MPLREVSKYGIFSGPHSEWIRKDISYLSVFSPNVGKQGPEKTPYLDTFHAVYSVVTNHYHNILKDVKTLQSRISRTQSRFQYRNAKSRYHSIYSPVQNIKYSSYSRRWPYWSFKVTRRCLSHRSHRKCFKNISCWECF